MHKNTNSPYHFPKYDLVIKCGKIENTCHVWTHPDCVSLDCDCTISEVKNIWETIQKTKIDELAANAAELAFDN